MTRNNNNNNSLSTMRYLTMIVALAPSVAAFSGQQRQPVASTGFNKHVSGTVSTRIPRSAMRTQATRLNYISEASNPDHTANAQKEDSSTWWNTIFARKESSATDDYLEFLDRRYNQILHDGEEEKASAKQGFSVMNWLYQGSANEEVEATTQAKYEDDALYVLGVANMASKEFLHKHHLPAPEEKKSKSTLDVTDAEIVTVTATPMPATAVVQLFRQVALRREHLIRQQNRTIRAALLCVLKQMATGPARARFALQRLWLAGGGKKSLAITFAAMATFTLFLRPLLKAVATEGANVMGP